MWRRRRDFLYSWNSLGGSVVAAGNVTLGICQRKVSARCFLLLPRCIFPLLFSYCVLENSSRLLFPPPLFTFYQRMVGDAIGIRLLLCSDAYLLHRTHYGRLVSIETQDEHCLFFQSTLFIRVTLVFQKSKNISP